MNLESERRFVRFPDAEAMSRFAAGLIAHVASRAVERNGRVSLVAAGGATPTPLYNMLVHAPHHAAVPWERLHLFWGDERCVPPDDPASNYLAARPLWEDNSRLTPERVHRIRGELPAREAAAQYEKELRAFFPLPMSPATHGRPDLQPEFPIFDLVLLGMGADGHVVSLFPGAPAIEDDSRWVIPVETPEGNPPVPRVTLTFPVINHADVVIILAAGSAKAGIIHELVFHTDLIREKRPVARVAPKGTLHILFAET